MTAVLNVLASNLGVLDTGPSTAGWSGYGTLTAGEGAPAPLLQIEDGVALTTAFLGAVGNYARILRVPSRAKVKKIEVFSDKALDTNAASTLKFNFGVAFSDGPNNGVKDGTPKSYVGLIPTSTFAGATTTFAAYASPNDLYGQVAQGNNVKIPVTDITLNGTQTTYSYLQLVQSPLVELFGFLDGRGVAIEEMGYMDIYAYVAAVSATPQAGNLFARAQFTVE